MTKLRDYQEKMVSETFELINCGLKTIMIQAPTGSGKTVVAGSVVNQLTDASKRGIFFAHRKELVYQAKDRFKSQFGINTGVLMSGVKQNRREQMQVASIDTYRGMVKKDKQFDCDFIVIDEAHHALSDSYKKMMKFHRELNPNTIIIGLSATPYRLSGEGFTEYFQKMVMCGKSKKQLQSDGSLVPCRAYVAKISKAKLDKISIVKGEYNEKQAAALMEDDAMVLDIFETYKAHADGKQMIVYASSVEHSKKIEALFIEKGYIAAHVDANTGKEEREQMFKDFGDKKIKILTNVGIATEGNDIPSIEVVAIAKLTKSLSLYLQMAGRGGRPAEGKTEYLLFDFGNCIAEHGHPDAEIDWNMHFIGIDKKKKKATATKQVKREKQYLVKIGEIEWKTTLSQLPDDFKGEILEEYSEGDLDVNYYIDKFAVFFEVSKVFNYKPIWSLFSLVKFIKEEGLPLPPQYVAIKIGEKLGMHHTAVTNMMKNHYEK